MTTVEPARRRPAAPLVLVGVCCVVAGGLVAAVTGPLRVAEGSWLAAYLVLVGGVAQCAFGLAPAQPVSRRPHWTLLLCWNAGNAAVIAGTLTDAPPLVDAGAVFLVIGLTIAWHAVRHISRSRHLVRAYRWLLLVLLVSIPVGIVLAHVRAPG